MCIIRIRCMLLAFDDYLIIILFTWGGLVIGDFYLLVTQVAAKSPATYVANTFPATQCLNWIGMKRIEGWRDLGDILVKNRDILSNVLSNLQVFWAWRDPRLSPFEQCRLLERCQQPRLLDFSYVTTQVAGQKAPQLFTGEIFSNEISLGTTTKGDFQ